MITPEIVVWAPVLLELTGSPALLGSDGSDCRGVVDCPVVGVALSDAADGVDGAEPPGAGRPGASLPAAQAVNTAIAHPAAANQTAIRAMTDDDGGRAVMTSRTASATSSLHARRRLTRTPYPCGNAVHRPRDRA